MAKLEIPVIVKCTEIDELIDEIKHLQTYKLFEGDEQVLIDRDDTIEIFAKHIRASAQPEQTEQRWIPCSERLPNCNGCYLVWRPHFFGGKIGMPSICYFDGKDTWHDSYGIDFNRILQPSDVTAWTPLPEPYKEEQDV